jgi:hypothetical protein
MHQTTVRFSAELWESLEEECARLGVSVAQFLREAALTRIAYAAGKRGDEAFERALASAVTPAASEATQPPSPRELQAIDAAERAVSEGSDAAALAAQGRQARQRSREMRAQLRRSRLI